MVPNIKTNMLQIKNLHASIEDKEILRGINLHVKKGEVHAIMGPNGSGKSNILDAICFVLGITNLSQVFY